MYDSLGMDVSQPSEKLPCDLHVYSMSCEPTQLQPRCATVRAIGMYRPDGELSTVSAVS